MPELPEETWLEFYFNACGLLYGFLLPLSGLAAMTMCVYLVTRGRGPLLLPTTVFVVLLPVFVGFFATVDHARNWLYFIAGHASSAPKADEYAHLVRAALATSWFGLCLMVPSLVIALGGMSWRALFGDRQMPDGS